MRDVPFEDRMAMLVDAEFNTRKSNRLKRLIRLANFDQPDACIANIDYHSGKNISKENILRLASCEYIVENKNVRPEDLKEMLYLVNRSDAVSESKLLSDTVYHFDKGTRLFERFDDYQKRISRNSFQFH